MRHHLRKIAVAALLLQAAVAGAQAPGTQRPELGRLLVANPALPDPNFAETVLLIVHHGQDGSLAIALNRPTWIAPTEAFPDVPDLSRYSSELYFGGPIAPSQLLIVYASADPVVENSREVINGLFITTDLSVFASLAPAAEGSPQIRLFAGHAQWNPGQLEAEIAAGNWRVLPAEESQIFDASAADLWDRLPLRAGGVTAALR